MDATEEKVAMFDHASSWRLINKKQVSSSIISLFPLVCVNHNAHPGHPGRLDTLFLLQKLMTTGHSRASQIPTVGKLKPGGPVPYFASIIFVFAMQVSFHHRANHILRDSRQQSETPIGTPLAV